MRLEVGYNIDVVVRKVHHTQLGMLPFRVAFLSDLHLNGRSGPLVRHLVQQVRALKPDLVLLGGDYADSSAGLRVFDHFLHSLSEVRKVYAIAGNHDRWLGAPAVKACVEAAGATWLDQCATTVKVGGSTVRLHGNGTYASGNADMSILCVHNPAQLEKEARHHQLAFAGHLHGGQVVLWQNQRGMYPGRWLYKWNRLSAEVNGCACLISRGLGDTLPIRLSVVRLTDRP